MTLRALLLLTPLVLFGCPAPGDGPGKDDEENLDKDSDGDGLLDSEEQAFGTDLSVADTDGDGLLDGEEYDLGTSGTEVDTDGDGYRDSDEITEGSDPTDASSLIYTGGWPYNAEKDAVDDPGWDGKAREGKQFPRFVGVDQYGEEVDIYDYAMQEGKPVVIDLSAEW